MYVCVCVCVVNFYLTFLECPRGRKEVLGKERRKERKKMERLSHFSGGKSEEGRSVPQSLVSLALD